MAVMCRDGATAATKLLILYEFPTKRAFDEAWDNESTHEFADDAGAKGGTMGLGALYKGTPIVITPLTAGDSERLHP
jgi:hypothetical protein